MTRHMLSHLSYTNDPSIEYRPARVLPQDRPLGLSMARQNPRTDPMSRQSSRAGPAPQPHPTTTNAGGTPRRRIPVACGRCRKRKIRCSGDPGDNTGCLNCKGAGVVQGQCVFLRVQCEMRELVPDHVLMMGGYEQVSSATVDLHPYSSSSSASSSSSSLALGLPHPSMSTSALHSGIAPQHFQHQHSMRHHGINPAGIPNNVMSLKAVYNQDSMGTSGGADSSGLLLSGGIGLSSHRNAYDGEMSSGAGSGSGISGGDLYNGGFPQYLQPEIGAASSLLSGQPGQWSPITSGGRQANASLYLPVDQDQAASMQSYMPAPSARMPANSALEGFTIFPALNSLSSSLPEGISSRATLSDRVTLPPPYRSQSSESSSLGNTRSSSGMNAIDMPTGPSYTNQAIQPRGGYSWPSGDSNFSSPPSASSMAVSTTKPPPTLGISPPLTYLTTPASHQPIAPPALPLPPALPSYGSNNSQTFPLSAANSSLLPSGSHSSSVLNSTFDSFTSQSLQSHSQAQKPHRSDSESSNGSKVTLIPAPTVRLGSTSSSSNSPIYSRSSVDLSQPLQRCKALVIGKVY